MTLDMVSEPCRPCQHPRISFMGKGMVKRVRIVGIARRCSATNDPDGPPGADDSGRAPGAGESDGPVEEMTERADGRRVYGEGRGQRPRVYALCCCTLRTALAARHGRTNRGYPRRPGRHLAPCCSYPDRVGTASLGVTVIGTRRYVLCRLPISLA